MSDSLLEASRARPIPIYIDAGSAALNRQEIERLVRAAASLRRNLEDAYLHA